MTSLPVECVDCYTPNDDDMIEVGVADAMVAAAKKEGRNNTIWAAIAAFALGAFLL